MAVDYKPHIGKNVIETLTLGMYEDARFIFREYVQNAADQIDIAFEENTLKSKSEGEINISIDKNTRSINIADNATGIKSDNILQFLGDVANSQKDREKHKGFRGIGRLGGLGYCEKLIFETSYFGEEVKSKIILNAKQLKKIIENKADTSDASTVISVITSLFKEDADKDSHFFKVTLEKVTNDKLLDQKSVSDYLRMVAPIAFLPDFEFKKKIYDYYKENKVAIDEYDIHLNINDTKLYKPYGSRFYKKGEVDSDLLNIVCFNFTDEDNEIIAIGWYGLTGKLNYIIPDENIEGGIRLRKENIAIGNKYTLSQFFGQPRQNLNYVGEVHAIGSGFTPNARRDYFNDSRTTSLLEDKLRELFSSLGGLTQDSSKLHNRKTDILKYKKEQAQFEIDSQSGELTERELESRREKLDKSKIQANYSTKEIKKIREKASGNEQLKVVYDHIIDDKEILSEEDAVDLHSEMQAFPMKLSKLTVEGKELVLDIFKVIDEILSLDEAEMLKKKIAERYN